MPDYDIYVLGESDVTVTGGNGQLDGVTGGNGSNLNGATITLTSNAWAPVSITDDDPNFQDSDGSQRLLGAQDIDGITYANNSVVEAEYGFTVSDGTNSWTLIGFNVNNSSPAYGTVEGLAFIGGPGDFPPINVPLTVTSTFEGPNFNAADYSTPICLTADTQVETSDGPKPIAQIRAGDHAMLVPALNLVDGRDVRLIEGGTVTYVHLLFDGHELIQSEGCWTESLLPGDMALNALLPHARAEVCALFPELEQAPQKTRSRHPVMRRYEAVVCAVHHAA